MMVVHFDWYVGGYLCKHDTTKYLWLVWDVQVLVAMVTRSVISSKQFNVVWRRVNRE